PAAAWVYELTPWGRELEPIVLALGAWGVRAAMPAGPTTLGPTSMLLFLRAAARPDPSGPATTYRLELDDRAWTVRTEAGRVEVRPGEPEAPDASLRTTPGTLNALLDDPAGLDAALLDGRAEAAGSLRALRRLLRSVGAT